MNKESELLDAYDIDCGFNVRSIDADERIIEGIATTPEVALDGMILEPRGIEYKLPVPFLMGHDINKPLGSVVSATVSDSGIAVRMQVIPAGIDEEVDRIFKKIKHGAIRGLSIRWKTLKETFDRGANALRITKSRWIELSATAVGVDQLARITHVRSMQEATQAASGRSVNPSSVVRISANHPGASGLAPGKPMIFKERIDSLLATRQEKFSRMQAIDEKVAAAGLTKDESEQQEFDELKRSIAKLNQELEDVRTLEELSKQTATVVPATAGTNAEEASRVRGGSNGFGTGTRNYSSGIQVVNSNLPKGTAFTRMAIAIYFAQGDRQRAAEIVESNRVWMDQTPHVASALRAPVTAGTTTTTGWAAELAPLQNVTGEFVELLRAATLIGKIQGFRPASFMSLIPRQTAGTEGDWVGEGGRKPVGRITVDNIELRPLKIAKIVAITEELARFSNPSAEAVVRQDLVEGIQLRMDRTFADPTVTAQAGVRPASVFNGAANSGSSGGDMAALIADLRTAEAHFTSMNMSLGGLAIITTENVAAGIGKLLSPLGVVAFPGVTASGGSVLGYNVYTSSVVPTGVVGFVKPSEVFLADDGQATVDVSNQASLVMDDGGSPSATVMSSLWQENKIGIKAERFVNWALRHPDSTYYLTAADYDGVA